MQYGTPAFGVHEGMLEARKLLHPQGDDFLFLVSCRIIQKDRASVAQLLVQQGEGGEAGVVLYVTGGAVNHQQVYFVGRQPVDGIPIEVFLCQLIGHQCRIDHGGL